MNGKGDFVDFQLEESDRLLQQTARELALREFAGDAFSYARTGEYPRRSMKVLADHGMMGMTVAEPHGGGQSIFEACLVMEAVSQVCPHSGDVVQMGNMGPIRVIDELGSTEAEGALSAPDMPGGEDHLHQHDGAGRRLGRYGFADHGGI